LFISLNTGLQQVLSNLSFQAKGAFGVSLHPQPFKLTAKLKINYIFLNNIGKPEFQIFLNSKFSATKAQRHQGLSRLRHSILLDTTAE
jgi:hypothetical protein